MIEIPMGGSGVPLLFAMALAVVLHFIFFLLFLKRARERRRESSENG